MSSSTRLRIAVMLPTLSIGGGNIVLRQFADHLGRTHDVTRILTQTDAGGTVPPGIARLEAVAGQHFDVAIASWWEDVLGFSAVDARRHVHLLQGPEWDIYPAGDPRSALIEELFRLPIPTVSVSSWLDDEARARGRPSTVVHSGVDKRVFGPDGAREATRSTRLRVLVEGPLGVWHKNVMTSLGIAKSVADETWLLTSTAVGPIPGVQRIFSCVPHERVGAIYRSCDVLLKLSYVEGFGLPPLEMFHTGGTSVLHDLPGHRDFARDGLNCLTVPIGDGGAAREVLERLRDQTLLRSLQGAALETARSWPDPETAASRFADTVEASARSESADAADYLTEIHRLSTGVKRDRSTSRYSSVPFIRYLRSARYALQLRRSASK